MLSEELSSSKIDAACRPWRTPWPACENCTATVEISGMTEDLTSQLSTGLTVKIYGTTPRP